MAFLQSAADISVIEPPEFQDIFCCGLHRVEVLGPCARFVLFANAPQPEPGLPVRRLLLQPAIVAPFEAIPPALRLMAQAVSRHLGRSALDAFLPH